MDTVKKLVGSMTIGELLAKGFTPSEIAELYKWLNAGR